MSISRAGARADRSWAGEHTRASPLARQPGRGKARPPRAWQIRFAMVTEKYSES